jgi:hypothetical protein
MTFAVLLAGLTACGTTTGGGGGGFFTADTQTSAKDGADLADAIADTADAIPDGADAADATADTAPDVAKDAVADGGICAPGTLECDDGDPCTNGDYCLLGQCIGYPISGCCTKKCAGKLCGPDGCGGFCGSCQATELCDDTFKCIAGGTSGDTCTSPTAIATLPYKITAKTTGLTDDYQAETLACAQDSLGFYAPDAVYRYTPLADGTLTVLVTGTDFPATVYAVTDCTDVKDSCLGGVVPYPSVIDLLPLYIDVKKGQDVFIIVDGDAKSGTYTLSVDACTPDCVDKQCGWSGCGKNCGECPMNIEWSCSDLGKCICTPSCAGKMCGDDGCGGTCGGCDIGLTCDSKGQCVTAGKAGDTCATAVKMSAFPYDYDGNTAGYGDDSYAWWACQGNGTSAYIGDGAPDQIFSVSPAKTTTYYALLTSSGNDPGFYARSNCSDPVACLQAGYKGFELKTQLFIEAPGGKETFFVVDSYNTGSLVFHIHLDACSTDTTCAEGTPGEYCSVAIPVSQNAPVNSSVGTALDSYTLPKGACGAKKDIGDGGQDVAYAFTAPKTGSFSVSVQGNSGMDPAIYILADCTQAATTCLGLGAATGANGLETAAFSASAGQTVYIVVDNETTSSGSFALTVK